MRQKAKNVPALILAILICSSMIFIQSPSASAEPTVHWTEGGLPLSGAGENCIAVDVVTDGSGGAIYAWIDSRGICAQRVGPGGNLLWGEDAKVLRPGTPADEYPSLKACTDGAGGAYVVWSEAPEVRALVVGSNGEKASGWEPGGTRVLMFADEDYLAAREVIPAPDGGAYICCNCAWSDEYGFKAICMDRNGKVRDGWPSGGMSCSRSIAPDGSGGFFFGNYQYHGPPGVLVERIDPNGSPHPGWEDGVFIPSPLGYSSDEDNVIALCRDGQGGCFVLFESLAPSPNAPPGQIWYLHYPYLCHVTADAEPDPNWGKVVELQESRNYAVKGHLVYDGRGGAIVTLWSVFYRVTTDKWFDPAWGGRSGRDIGIYPNLAVTDGAGGFFPCETTKYNKYYYIDVLHLAATGEIPSGWPPEGIRIADCTGGPDMYSPTVKPAGNQTMLAAWADDRNTPTPAPYAQKLTDPPNFYTYILLQNPNDKQVEATLTFMLPAGDTKEVKRTVPGDSRTTVLVNDEVPALDVSTRVQISADSPIIAERSMYFDYKGTYQGGHDCTGVTAPGTTWYLAEGYTANQFDTYLLLQNPGEDTADVTVTYMLPGSETVTGTYTVPPHSRYTVSVDVIPGLESTELSMKIDSSVPICAERAMYFNYYGRIGGHDQAAVPAPQETWYLPEGYTGEEFDTYVLVQNPGDTEATVTYTFMRDDGENVTRQEKVGPHSRFTVKVDDIPELASAMFSTKVSSDVPVIAERAMYFDYKGKDGGHDSVGATSPSDTWYLAEGYTAEEFDTYVLMQNTGDITATVEATYMLPWGDPVVETYQIASNSRYTVKLDDIPGLEATEVSTKLETTGGAEIIAERAIYFTYQDKWSGGHDAIGVTEPSDTWYFAEGYTGY